jgi:hypothetical protein
MMSTSYSVLLIDLIIGECSHSNIRDSKKTKHRIKSSMIIIIRLIVRK